MIGKVYLVGAGPGDYKLITLKGLECIQNADVIIYDRLINPKLLDFSKEKTELIYVGKSPEAHTYTQENINKLIVEKALKGNVVTRLKGGDPFVFGRGGEEALLLKENKVEFEIVPGITSAISVPAYAGIPVTHRNVSSSFHVITGHEDPDKACSEVDFESLAQLKGTLIFLMGIKNIEKICKNLIKYGQPPARPVTLIRKGTTTGQQLLKGTLEDMADQVKQNNFKNPAVIVVGEVGNLSDDLSWYDQKPLFGKKILVTRSRAQASVLSRKIEDLGGEAVEFPTIKINKLDDYFEIDKAIGEIEKYKWMIFTSVNGVKYFFERLNELNLDIRILKNIKLCAIGPATAEVLMERGLIVEYIPSEYRAESIVQLLKDKVQKGDDILLPRADLARKVLETELTKLGAIVNNIDIYKTELPDNSSDELRSLLKNKKIDMMTFTSSSTAKNFVKLLGEENLDLIKDIETASIGAITSDTAQALGIEIDIQAKEYTIDGLVNAVLNHFKKGCKEG